MLEMVKDYGFKVLPELEKAAFGKSRSRTLRWANSSRWIQPSAREVDRNRDRQGEG